MQQNTHTGDATDDAFDWFGTMSHTWSGIETHELVKQRDVLRFKRHVLVVVNTLALLLLALRFVANNVAGILTSLVVLACVNWYVKRHLAHITPRPSTNRPQHPLGHLVPSKRR